jgi:hypothetical protein
MNKKLALVEEKEIAEIKRKHLSIYDAARQSLSTAIEIGQWFNEKHKEIEHGGWLKWLRENFAEISDDSVRNYIRLAQNRKLLEANLQIPNARNLEWPSIREALRQIDSLKKEEQDKEEKATRPRKAACDEPTEVEAAPDEADDDVEFPFDEDAKRTGKPVKKTKAQQAETGEKVLTLSSRLDELNDRWGPQKGPDNVFRVTVDCWRYTVERVAPQIDAMAETGRAAREREARNAAASR